MKENQWFLDFVDRMPEEKKKCGVRTLEDGSGTVDLGDFIVHYGQALWTEFQRETKPKRMRKSEHENNCGK